MGFVKVRLEVIAINSFCIPAFDSGLANIGKHWFLIFNFIKSRAAVTGGRNSMIHLTQSPNSKSKFNKQYFYRNTSAKRMLF